MDRADARALVWIIGATGLVVAGFLIAWPVGVAATGYALMTWAR